MAEFLKAISCWEGGRGRGFVDRADVDSPSPVGSDEMRPVRLGSIGIGRGVRSSKSKTPTCPEMVKDAASFRLSQLCMENVDSQGEEGLFDKGQAGDVRTPIPAHSMTLRSVPSANLKPAGHVLARDFAITPKPPEHDQPLGSMAADTFHPSVTTPGALISEYIHPLDSLLDFDAGQPLPDSVATTTLSPHASTVTTTFLPGVHHPQRDSKTHDEPVLNEPPMSLEPTVANILQHTFQLLSQRPGIFIGVMPALVSILKVNLHKEEDVHEIIDSLCFASINDDNFRYNGARVCTHLAEELKSFRFLDHLLKRCEQEFNNGSDSVWFAGEQKLCGKVALFVGELMIQLQAEVGQPSEILIRFVLRLLHQLLTSDDEAQLKCLVQLLKLTGARLNMIVEQDLDQIMTEIRRSVLLKAPTRRSRELLLSVVELDARGWMRDDEHDTGRGACGQTSPATAVSPLSPEEAKGVYEQNDEQNVMINLELAADSDSGNIEFDDFMEEERIGLEIAHCYEQYLRDMGKDDV